MPNCHFAPVWPRLGCTRHGVDRPAMARPPEMRCWGLAAGAQGQAVAAGGTGTGRAGSGAGPPARRAEDANAAGGGAWIAHGQLSISCSGPRKREQGGSTAPGRRRELGWLVLGGGKLATAAIRHQEKRRRSRALAQPRGRQGGAARQSRLAAACTSRQVGPVVAPRRRRMRGCRRATAPGRRQHQHEGGEATPSDRDIYQTGRVIYQEFDLCP